MQSIHQFHRIGRDVRYQLQKKGQGSIHRNLNHGGESSKYSSGSSSPRSGRADLEKQESNIHLERGRPNINIPAGYAVIDEPCPLMCQDDFGMRNARLLPGVEIKDNIKYRGNGSNKSFLVGQDPKSVTTDPRKWSLKLRIWATYAVAASRM